MDFLVYIFGFVGPVQLCKRVHVACVKAASQPYEELLNNHRYTEALHAALTTNRPQVIGLLVVSATQDSQQKDCFLLAQVVEYVINAMLRNGLFRTMLLTGPTELLVGLLRHSRRQLNEPQHARPAIAVAQHVVSCRAVVAIDATGCVQMERLAAAVLEELQVQEHFLNLLSLISSLCVSDGL